MPRRNPDAPQRERTPYYLADGTAVYEGETPPPDALPGDILTRDGEIVGALALDASNRVVVIGHARAQAIRNLPNTYQPAARWEPSEPGRSMSSVIEDVAAANGVTLPGVPTVEPADHPSAPGIIAAMNEGLARVNSQTAALRSALTNVTPAARYVTPAAEEREAARLNENTYAGPRMLATVATSSPGAADRFTRHTATAQAAAERAEVEYRDRARYAIFRRRAEDPVTGNIVDRNASHIERFLISGFGLELNEEALTAVTAMATVITRAAVEPMKARAQLAESEAAILRNRAESLQATVDTMREAQMAPGDPGPLVDATAAARAWKETPLTDSVAKRDSFLHLLATLERLA